MCTLVASPWYCYAGLNVYMCLVSILKLLAPRLLKLQMMSSRHCLLHSRAQLRWPCWLGGMVVKYRYCLIMCVVIHIKEASPQHVTLFIKGLVLSWLITFLGLMRRVSLQLSFSGHGSYNRWVKYAKPRQSSAASARSRPEGYFVHLILVFWVIWSCKRRAAETGSLRRLYYAIGMYFHDPSRGNKYVHSNMWR